MKELRRDRTKVITDILRIALEGSIRTQIVYGANLNYKILKRYLDHLQDHGMIEKVDRNDSIYYKTTEKGKAFLKHFNQLQLVKLKLREETDFPQELVEPIKALSDRTRRQIILVLLNSNHLSYSQILNLLDIKKGTLNHHLQTLVSSGIIRNFGLDKPAEPYNSYYAITEFGRKFLKKIREILEPDKIMEVTRTR